MLVIFGASGDLTKRKLIPSLFELYSSKMLPQNFAILGAARSPYDDESYRAFARENLLKYSKDGRTDTEELEVFLRHVFYVSFNTDDENEYGKLDEKIKAVQKSENIPDRIVFDLATPPNMYEKIPSALQKFGINKAGSRDGWRRIIIEKPFGTDFDSAEHLNEHLLGIFEEKGIYRIDHYLGKETVQNILVLRFSNGIFEPLWNRNYIDFVEISVTETLGIENRGPYYEHSGAMRDMIQNHIMHLMAFVAMEAPANFDPESIRDEISKVFRSIRPMSPADLRNNVVRGQYGAGVIDGKLAKAYIEEKDVAPTSQTETYVSMKLFIDNWRWNGVPFYFTTGKAMPEKKSEIVIHFKETPQKLFVSQCAGDFCNRLVIRIQPNESISVMFGLKVPGAGFEVRQVSMDFKYSSLDNAKLPDAYERLLLDSMLGDSTLYARNDALAASWSFVDPILDFWKNSPDAKLYYYPAGTNGPQEGAALIRESLRDDNCKYDPDK